MKNEFLVQTLANQDTGTTWHGLLDGDQVTGIYRVEWDRGVPVGGAVYHWKYGKWMDYFNEVIRQLFIDTHDTPWKFLTQEEADEVIEQGPKPGV